jgi:uncharacterized membrane protein YfcA
VTVVATISVAKIGSGLASGLAHWQAGNVRKGWILPILFPAVIGAVAAASFVAHAPKDAIRIATPILLILMGLLILRRALRKDLVIPTVAGGSPDAAQAAAPCPRLLSIPRVAPQGFWLGLVGFIGGILNGLSGAFGPFTTSSLLLLDRGHPRYVVGTVNFVEFFVALSVAATLISQVSNFEMSFALPLALISGALVTSHIGARMARRVDPRLLALAIAATLVGLNAWSITSALL